MLSRPTPLVGRSTRSQDANFLQSAELYQHLIGRGDLLRLSVFRAPEFSGTTRVSAEGSIKLPYVGAINLEGLTISQAEARISSKLKAILREPLVTLTLAQARPTRISVLGQVVTPGVYTFVSLANPDALTGLNSEITPTNGTTAEGRLTQAAPLTENVPGGDRNPRELTVNEPTLTAAIIRAGGVQTDADAANVVVTRRLSNGEVLQQKVNLFTVVRSGSPVDDPYLMDGDTIEIPKVAEVNIGDVVALSSTNIAPRNIRVNVVGEVVQPGSYQLRSDSSLNDAILSAGGFSQEANRGQVELIRQADDGTRQQVPIKVDYKKGLNTAENPLLRNGDTIVVAPSGMARFSRGLGSLLSPLLGIGNPASTIRSVFRN
jgi:polysaccharide export outer membrane protein